MSRATEIQQLYIGLLGRAADPVGLDYWTNNGLTIDEIAANIVNEQDEFAFTEEQRQDAVEALYVNLFGRAGTEADINYWTNESETPVDQLLFTMIQGAGTNDAAALTNRTYVANAYTQFADFDKEAAAAVIAGVDHTPKSVSDALATIEGAAGDPTAALEAYVAAQEAVAAAVEESDEADEADLLTFLEGERDGALAAVATTAGITLGTDSEGVIAAKITDTQAALAQAVAAAQTDLNTATTALNQFSGLKRLVDAKRAAEVANDDAQDALDVADAALAEQTIVANGYASLHGGGTVADYVDTTTPGRAVVDVTAAELAAEEYTEEQATEFLAALAKYASLYGAQAVAAGNKVITADLVLSTQGNLDTGIDEADDSVEAQAAVDLYEEELDDLSAAQDAQAGFAVELADLAEATAALEAFEALTDARDEAFDALSDTGFAVADLGTGPHSTITTEEADLYVFGGYEGGEAVTISGFGALDQDMIFFGEGFSLVELAAGTNINTTRVGDAGAQEIFWLQQGANTVLYVELDAEAGRDIGADATANLVTITLTGVTGAELTGLQDGYFVA